MGSTHWYFVLGVYTARLLGQAMIPSIPIRDLEGEKKPFRSKSYDGKSEILKSIKKGTLGASSYL